MDPPSQAPSVPREEPAPQRAPSFIPRALAIQEKSVHLSQVTGPHSEGVQEVDGEGEPLINAAAGRNIRKLLRSWRSNATPNAKAKQSDEILALPPSGGRRTPTSDQGVRTSPSESAKRPTKRRRTDPDGSHMPQMPGPGPSKPKPASGYPQNPLLQLHNEILDFEQSISPTKEETARRMQVVNEIRNLAIEMWPERANSGQLRVEIFGSTLTGLALPSSDVDIVIFGAPPKAMFRIAKKMRQRNMVSFLQVIAKARVPIVKLTHRETGMDADICFDQPSGPRMGKLIKHMLAVVPALRPLVLVLKYFLAQRSLNETYKGGVGSFLLQIMVIASLQHHGKMRQNTRWKKLQAIKKVNGAGAEKWRRKRENLENAQPHSLGIMLLEFLELFGKSLNYERVGISVRGQGSFFPKASRGWLDGRRPWTLSIENPENPTVDIGKNSFQIRFVRQAMEHSYHLLSGELSRISEILDGAAKKRKRSQAPRSTSTSLLSRIIDVAAARQDAHVRIRK